MPASLIARLIPSLALGAVTIAFTSLASATEPDGALLFRSKVRPLLIEKCLACHGQKPEDLKGALDLRSRGAM
ncbi:MAG TPA: hypothetical protein VM165_15460, partial [Planctomycetaceae bacterium]|nr:hypothetical protein [Planctomycetaceae bacterium]